MNKKFKVNYLSRDFSSIKQDLKDYAKRYYPSQFSDLSEASINTFVIDAVAYVGDILSYYTDYQGNESFLSTAVEPENILKLAKELGYRRSNTTTSTGVASLYLLIPAKADGSAPDYDKVPVIKSGTVFTSAGGDKNFLVADDIIIDNKIVGSTYVPARTNAAGNPTFYAVKIPVPVISGEIATFTTPVFGFTAFNKIQLPDYSTTEIISVTDSDGNEYHEVQNLSQNIVYRSVANDTRDSSVKNILRTISAQRRFVFDFDGVVPYLMFGGKQYKPDDDLTIDPVAEPNKYILERYNSGYLAEEYFDPNRLVNGDKFGVGPDNTTLTITYRKNSSLNNNVSAGELNVVKTLLTEFKSGIVIDDTTKNTILQSVQIINEEQIVGDNFQLSLDQIKDLSGMIYQAQNRAVTAKDYETLTHMMPAKYGSISKVKAERDPKSLKNNINLYIVCQDAFGQFTQSNTKIKENLKYWLSGYKMITDTVDILDAKVINIGFSYTILVDPMFVKAEVRNNVQNQLIFYYSTKLDIGQQFNILDIYREIRKIKGVLDVKDIKVRNLTDFTYSQVAFDIAANTSSDGNSIFCPRNAVFEIKNLASDIVGVTL
jgi:hypothetical protein